MVALLALSFPSLTRQHSHATRPARNMNRVPSARFNPPHLVQMHWRSQLISSSKARNENVLHQTDSTVANADNEFGFPSKLLEHSYKAITLASLSAASLFAANPANAAYSFGDPITEENLPSFLIRTSAVLAITFIYFIAAPLGIYYYLYKRWFKRKMVEAIFQFLLVFLFFPGMLALAPFINFRGAPQEGAKEPWDEIRPE